MPARSRLLVPLATVAIVATATLLASYPTVHRLHGWFWKLREKRLAVDWLVVTAGVIVLLTLLAWRLRRRPWRAVGCVFLLAAANQFGLGLAEGRGLDALRERAVFAGHGEFVSMAAQGVPAEDLLTHYEKLAAAANHPFFAVKPPGQLLTYVALDRLAQRVVPEDALAGHPLLGALTPRHRQLVELLAWLLPWLAALAVFPIAGLTRALSNSDLWLTAPLLFALSAPLTLITLHLDQALYPGAVATLWWCSVCAGRSEHRTWAFGIAGGLVAWLLGFLSFGLLPAVVLAPGLVAAAAPQRRLR